MSDIKVPSFVEPENELGDHALLDRASRQMKGQKIRNILARRRNLSGLDVLDVGAGAGYIAEVFVDEVLPDGQVHAVDRLNQLKAPNIHFTEVESTALPFSDASYDIALTNHVIEHVGGRSNQVHHLAEIARVLRDDGIIYLAVPNRWTLFERHFNLPFLSWFPERLASKYVRLMKRGTHYDCRLLSRSDLSALFEEVGLELEDITIEALQLVADQEIGGRVGRMIKKCPKFLLHLAMIISPTLVVLGTKADHR